MNINIPGPYIPDAKAVSLDKIRSNTDKLKADVDKIRLDTDQITANLEKESTERKSADKKSQRIALIALVLSTVSTVAVIIQLMLQLTQ